jgi:hypothetical protein
MNINKCPLDALHIATTYMDHVSRECFVNTCHRHRLLIHPVTYGDWCKLVREKQYNCLKNTFDSTKDVLIDHNLPIPSQLQQLEQILNKWKRERIEEFLRQKFYCNHKGSGFECCCLAHSKISRNWEPFSVCDEQNDIMSNNSLYLNGMESHDTIIKWYIKRHEIALRLQAQLLYHYESESTL